MEAYIQWPGFEPASEENQWEHKQHFMFRTICMLIVFMILIVTSKIYAFVQKKRGRDVYLPGQQTPSWTDSDSEQKHGSEIEFIESTAKMIKK